LQNAEVRAPPLQITGANFGSRAGENFSASGPQSAVIFSRRPGPRPRPPRHLPPALPLARRPPAGTALSAGLTSVCSPPPVGSGSRAVSRGGVRHPGGVLYRLHRTAERILRGALCEGRPKDGRVRPLVQGLSAQCAKERHTCSVVNAGTGRGTNASPHHRHFLPPRGRAADVRLAQRGTASDCRGSLPV
jgi:hypothetical protein